MAPVPNRPTFSLFHRSADALSSTTHSLIKRVYYYYQPNTGAIIAGVVISVLFLLIAVVSLILRCKYGWSWYGRSYYGRPYNNPTYVSYAGPNNTAYGAGAGYNGGAYGYERRWPGQTSHFPAPGQVGENGTELNAYGMPRGPGTYEPPPMYSGPGSFYQSGKHGPGTNREAAPYEGSSRLEEHPGLRNANAQR